MRDFGLNLERWRKTNGLTATRVAERAFITRATLRDIEAGKGTARMDSLFAVLMALGIADELVAASDPYNNPAARARIDDLLGVGGET